MLRVSLLGELQAEVEDRPVTAPASRRAWSLLGWLALHPGEHPRGAVAARFWPDVLDASARASLRSAAWALRKALGAEDALTGGRDRIGLRCRTDLAEFDAHVAAGRLQEAVALHRGPLLADFDDDWVLEARDEHGERLGAALARLADAASSPEDAVAHARRRLGLDPLDEDAARDLMRRLVAAGDRPGALAVYDRLSERLRKALGLAPSGDTRALAARVREAPAAAVLDAAPLVGRAPEQAALARVWDHVRTGAGAVAVIAGEPGIGKTRLATELLARADDARTARCTAVNLGGAPPFAPWAELLAGLARRLDAPPPEERWPEELARLAPSLPRRLGRPAAPPADVPPDLARARLFEAAVELAEHATRDRPLVLLFDDIHLADDPSIELAAYVARRIEPLPVLLLLTRRTAPRRDVVDALLHAARGRGVAVHELELQPLPRHDVERLVAAAAPLDAAARERVIAAAEGNPLLALESARAAARGEQGPPTSLRGAVRAAVAGLPEPARRAAEVAAVAGRDLDRGELAALAGPEAVVSAMDSGLFRSADGRFGFRHALLRDAVLADLDDSRRRLAHEALGRSLKGAAECARHLRAAGHDGLAAGRLREAAADATRATALEEAARYLGEALELDDDPPTRMELAATFAMLGRREPTLREFEAALRGLEPEHRPAAHLRAALWFFSSLCDPPSAKRSAEQGLEALAGDPELRTDLLLVRAWAEATASGGAQDTLREVEALGCDLGRPPLRRHNYESVRAHAALADGRLAEAEALLVRSAETGERAARPDMAYGGWTNASCVATAAGDPDRALAHAERADAIVAGLPALAFQTSGLRACALAALGRHGEARAAADRQAELSARLGSARLAAMADHDGGLLALRAGDHERAQVLLRRALAADPPIHRAEARLWRAEALARLGRPDEADAEIRAATLEPMRPAHRPAVLIARMTFAQGLSARARGDLALAERRFKEAEGHWRRLEGGAGHDHLASLVDLGRPPVTGVVDPAAELARVAAERSTLETVAT